MRILVVQHGTAGSAWQATVRDGANWTVGDFDHDYETAIRSALEKFYESNGSPAPTAAQPKSEGLLDL